MQLCTPEACFMWQVTASPGQYSPARSCACQVAMGRAAGDAPDQLSLLRLLYWTVAQVAEACANWLCVQYVIFVCG
jgi:hypothetical protein